MSPQPSPSARLLPDTSAWLAAAPSDDASAFGRLVVRCLPGLYRWAHRRLPRWLRGVNDTADLVQDVVLRTICQRPAIDVGGQRALAAYLREAVRNRICDEHRRIARRGHPEELPDDLADPAASAFDRLAAREAQARYRAALARLALADRELIVAHLELDYTHEQLGCMTGRSANAARMALQRAVRRLAAQMRDG
jgi:RNA polymerase sigma factor (sigma-70 family)